MKMRVFDTMELVGSINGVCEEMYMALLERVKTVAERICPTDEAFELFDLAREGKLIGWRATYLNAIFLALQREFAKRVPKGYKLEVLQSGKTVTVRIVEDKTSTGVKFLEPKTLNAPKERRVTDSETYNKLLIMFGGDKAYLNRCLQRAAQR